MLLGFGLISREDLRTDFGESKPDSYPEPDSDLEIEMSRDDYEMTEDQEKILNGIEHKFINEQEKLSKTEDT